MKLFNFAKNESGAVTVDWVVLTAAIVILGTGIFTAVQGGMTNASSDMATSLSGLQ